MLNSVEERRKYLAVSLPGSMNWVWEAWDRSQEKSFARYVVHWSKYGGPRFWLEVKIYKRRTMENVR